MGERWKTIPEYSSYQISDRGRVMSLYRNHKSGKRINTTRILQPITNKSGYLHVTLYQNGKQKTCKVHQFVMAASLGPCPEGLEVNHRDGNKQNNRLENLEYVTSSENHLHAYRNGLAVGTPHHEKAVNQFTKDGQFIAEYISQNEAFRQTGVNLRNISSCCHGKLKSAGGYVWKYSESEQNGD